MQDAKNERARYRAGATFILVTGILSGGVGILSGESRLITAGLIFTGVAAIIAWGLLVLAIGQGQEEALNAELQNLIHRIQEDTDASRPPPREPDERP